MGWLRMANENIEADPNRLAANGIEQEYDWRKYVLPDM
jgi:hypothetical protein